MDFDGCLTRWTVAHFGGKFGQAPAGWTLNCIALCLFWHMALRSPAAGERRGDSITAGNVSVWVDDFFTGWSVRILPAQAWKDPGGCPVCLENLQ